jgi:hypothetical protein
MTTETPITSDPWINTLTRPHDEPTTDYIPTTQSQTNSIQDLAALKANSDAAKEPHKHVTDELLAAYKAYRDAYGRTPEGKRERLCIVVILVTLLGGIVRFSFLWNLVCPKKD